METAIVTSKQKRQRLGSPGVDELRWLLLILPDDQLHIRATILEIKISESKPDRDLVHSCIEVLNQKRKVVMSLKAVNFLLRRTHPVWVSKQLSFAIKKCT
ncbi:MAG: hypothetical protein HN945_17565 [Deltaproteobacteria bacterium]|jgi:acyl dehydratase|nr:hypothetical protein [Deltaproteobacteria bacterium]MBT4643564.1 hypothetical protein [Deltaproteobacteria bacterium]MBT6611069.1 hypothetical protein [Deltaproteobacteria bacterium]MBT7154247.1 hypothetical protein [Deltaproteobacteria bacterium]MBT7710687.1 hypothetical protein [Deltaproteobacteria bacterium]